MVLVRSPMDMSELMGSERVLGRPRPGNVVRRTVTVGAGCARVGSTKGAMAGIWAVAVAILDRVSVDMVVKVVISQTIVASWVVTMGFGRYLWLS